MMCTFVLYCFLTFCCCVPKYLVLNIHYSGDCSEENFINQWMVKNPTEICTKYPWNKYVTYFYDSLNENVTIREFSDDECQDSISTTNYSYHECHQMEGYEMVWSVNFSIADEGYYGQEILPSWVVQEDFLDTQCQEPAPHFGKANYIKDSTIYARYLENITQMNYWNDYFCTEDYLVTSYGIDEAYKIWRRSDADRQCFEQVNNTFFMYKDYWLSQINTCMNRTEFEETILPLLSLTSSHQYRFWKLFYSETCDDYLVQNRVVENLDNCLDSTFTHAQEFATETSFVKLYFQTDDADCSGDLKEFKVILSKNGTDSIWNLCNFESTHPIDENVEYFRMYELSDDPYAPGDIATFDAFIDCQESIDEFIENPGREGYVTYHTPWADCIGFEDFSISGYCDEMDGTISVDFFHDSASCVGRNDFIWETSHYCEEHSDGVEGKFFHATCIPYYCFGISGLEFSEVCSGRGTCSGKDECDCAEGYDGENCEVVVQQPSDDDDDDSQEGANVVGIVLGVLFGVGTPIICIFTILLCLLCFFFCCVLSLCFCCVLGLCGIGGCLSMVDLKQKKRLSILDKIDDVEMVIQEQEHLKDSSIAHLRINPETFSIKFDDIKIGKIIGEGGSESTVFLAYWEGQPVAFKCFKTRRLMSNQDNFDRFEEEMNVLAQLTHPNIIRFFGASFKPPRVGLVMEYCENGEILTWLVKYRMNIDPQGYPVLQKIRMVREIVSAMSYIHSRKIIHRDLKPENILLDGSLCTKIMDFGISKVVQTQNAQKTKRIGTSFFMAPEILTGKYDSMCDSFSFAVVCYCLFSEKPDPYETRMKSEGGSSADLMGLEFRVANDPNFRPRVKDVCVSFGEDDENSFGWITKMMVRCWDADPSTRMNFLELTNYFDEESQRYNAMLQNKTSSPKSGNNNNRSSRRPESLRGGGIFDSLRRERMDSLRGRSDSLRENLAEKGKQKKENDLIEENKRLVEEMELLKKKMEIVAATAEKAMKIKQLNERKENL